MCCIVVEGPDGSGKSTLVQTLSSHFGLEVGQRGTANRDRLWAVTRQDTYRALAAAVQADEPPKVWDRLWISEYVYHDINPKRPCEFSSFETPIIRGVLNALGAPIILCLPPYDVVEENARAVHQMEGVDAALPEIYARYHSGSLPWPNNLFLYDYTGQEKFGFLTYGSLLREVASYIVKRHGREAWQAVPA